MRESFLHFIWQFQKFKSNELKTVDGQPITICTTGILNLHSGPDFQQAKLVIGEMTWFGHVEIHVRSSDWYRHRHHLDEAYNNVILHVVYEHDRDVITESGNQLPVLELKDRIPFNLLQRCNQLIKSPHNIPCAGQLPHVREIDKVAMMDQSGISRIKKKADAILQLLTKNVGDWEGTTYQVLTKSFGFKSNDMPFFDLSELIPRQLMIRHSKSELQSEALIFGMAGFLDLVYDDYQQSLKHEFDYIAKKYKLTGHSMVRAQWKFLRLRPSNFPSVRLAQYAGFIRKNVSSFDRFIHFKDSRELRSLFDFKPSEYWQVHYDFDKKFKKKANGLGASSIDLILINTVAPLLAAYARYTDSDEHMEKAVRLLQEIKPEQNQIIHRWKTHKMIASNAFDSQSLIELRNEYCLKKKCLYCKIGVSLVNN